MTPIVNYCEGVREIDATRLGLIRVSFGGYLAPRAAAYEHRIRAVVTIDGLFDGYASVLTLLGPRLRALLEARDEHACDAAIQTATQTDGSLRWYIDQALWVVSSRDAV